MFISVSRNLAVKTNEKVKTFGMLQRCAIWLVTKTIHYKFIIKPHFIYTYKNQLTFYKFYINRVTIRTYL